MAVCLSSWHVQTYIHAYNLLRGKETLPSLDREPPSRYQYKLDILRAEQIYCPPRDTRGRSRRRPSSSDASPSSPSSSSCLCPCNLESGRSTTFWLYWLDFGRWATCFEGYILCISIIFPPPPTHTLRLTFPPASPRQPLFIELLTQEDVILRHFNPFVMQFYSFFHYPSKLFPPFTFP